MWLRIINMKIETFTNEEKKAKKIDEIKKILAIGILMPILILYMAVILLW